MFEQFQFIRPEFLWCLLIPALLSLLLWYLRREDEQLNNAIDPVLADVLITGKRSVIQKLNLKLVTILTLLSIAAAGPAFDKAPAPTGHGDKATFFVLDLSPSMYAQDLTPSRMDIAKRKLEDFLNYIDTDLYSLIVFSGEAYSVVPTTDDKQTISSLLPSLNPGLMPTYGSDIEATIKMLREQILDHTGTSQIVWITDGIHEDAISEFNQLSRDFTSAVLMIGSEQGARIPTSSGYLRNNGEIVIAKITPSNLGDLAVEAITRSTATNQDVVGLADSLNSANSTGGGEQSDETYDKLVDRGPFIAAVVLLLMLGWLRPVKAASTASIALLSSALVLPNIADADNIFQTDERQTYNAYLNDPSLENAQRLSDPRWRAHALAEHNQYQQALETLGTITEPSSYDLINIANNLVREGAYPQAIANYQRVLIDDSGNEIALTGKAIAEALQQQADQQQQQGNDKSESEDSEQDQQESKPNEQENNDGSDDQQDQQQDQQQGEQPNQKQQDQQNTEPNQQQPDQQPLSDEERISQQELDQELEQLLRSLPDDPGGLLRRKFRYQYEQNRRARATDKTQGERW